MHHSFKISDYYLDEDERIAKFKDFDLILCEKCNQKIKDNFYYCKDCYSKETDDMERDVCCMKHVKNVFK